MIIERERAVEQGQDTRDDMEQFEIDDIVIKGEVILRDCPMRIRRPL